MRVAFTPTPYLNARRQKISFVQAMLWGKDTCLERVLKQHRIDLLFESAQVLRKNLRKN